MNKDKMVKVRLLNGSDYPLPANIFPLEVEGRLADDRGVLVHCLNFMRIITDCRVNEGWVFFNKQEYELITEEDLTPQQQTIEQLLEELAQLNADVLALANRKNELLGELNSRLNKHGYKLEE